jgi:hypothetical protein
MKRLSAIGRGLVRILLLWTAFTGLAAAQGRRGIRGVVTTLGPDGQPVSIPGVTLLLRCEGTAGAPTRTTTDETGGYSFAVLAPGKCRLTVSAPGFREETREVEIKADTTAKLNIQLDLETVVQKVEVHGQEEQLSTENVGPASTIQSQQLETLPMAEQKFKEALRVVPGVIRTSDGKLNIRGSAENQGMLEVDSARTVDPVTGSFSIPVPTDAIQKLSVDKTPYGAQHGGFSGGLATIETKPPSGAWNYKLSDFLPSIRGKQGHWVGYSEAVPRLFFGGPLLPGKLNFSEAFQYEMEKVPVRGLAWPHNEIKSQGFNSFTSFQAFLSSKHVLTADINVFPRRTQFANITALVPQTASSDYGQKGISGTISDLYQFSSGAFLRTGLRYTRFDSNAHGQGPEDMLLTPEGWGGNFFNTWSRNANEFEAFPVFQFAPKTWHGHHELKVGADVSYRSYRGRSVSHPVKLLREDGTLAEQIDSQDNGPLSASVAEGSEFIQDHWMINDHLALDWGGRLTSQSVGRSAAFAPRVAVAYSPGKDHKTTFRAGAGLFYGRLSLLDADFAHNPTRIVSLFDVTGKIIGKPVAFQNTYVANGLGPLASRIRREPNASPRSFVGNVEVDRELWRQATLRLGYIYSQTDDLFVVNPLPGALGGNSLLGLSNSGSSRYNEFEATLHFQPIQRSDLNVSYIWSRTRGELNTSSDIFVPFEQPVIRPNVSSITASDVPNRMVAWGIFHLPWELTVSLVIDIHTGFPYSNVDVFQNYVGRPEGQRFPTFFSLDMKAYRAFHLPLPYVGRSSRHKIRLGLYSINLTNHHNYRDVFNNVTSPFFRQFTGFQHRINGFVLEVAE